MSSKLRRGCSWSVLIVGAQALAFAALAQQTPDTPRPPPPDRATPSDTARPMPPSSATGGTPSTDRDTKMDRSRSMDHADKDHSAMMKNVTPQSFATQAAAIGTAEVELGQLALKKSQDADVRKFAQRMVKDHTAANEKLKKIAKQENLSLPQALDAEHQAVKQKLSSLEGEAFDREYKKEMAKGHGKAVALFESASQTQQMPDDLKQFAASTLPTLEEHEQMAESMDAMEGGRER